MIKLTAGPSKGNRFATTKQKLEKVLKKAKKKER
jgi:hypothetical protein